MVADHRQKAGPNRSSRSPNRGIQAAMPTTYAAHNLAKLAGSHFLPGSGDAASAVSAEAKSQALGDILQKFYQAWDEEFDGTDIGQTEVKKAILYVRGKKHTKALRKGVLAGTKFGLGVAATVGGATAGSVVPGLGTALGGLGGFVAGASLGAGVTVLDRMKRSAKGVYKWARNTRGAHRAQAAATLMHCAAPAFDWANGRNPADEALIVILQEEYERVVREHDLARLAARMKSN
jgi:hypothetical protein